MDQIEKSEARRYQKAWLRGEKLPESEDEPSAQGDPQLRLPAAPNDQYIDPDGSMGQPLPGLRERPVGYGL